jgi:hypothetical protein
MSELEKSIETAVKTRTGLLVVTLADSLLLESDIAVLNDL